MPRRQLRWLHRRIKRKRLLNNQEEVKVQYRGVNELRTIVGVVKELYFDTKNRKSEEES